MTTGLAGDSLRRCSWTPALLTTKSTRSVGNLPVIISQTEPFTTHHGHNVSGIGSQPGGSTTSEEPTVPVCLLIDHVCPKPPPTRLSWGQAILC